MQHRAQWTRHPCRRPGRTPAGQASAIVGHRRAPSEARLLKMVNQGLQQCTGKRRRRVGNAGGTGQQLCEAGICRGRAAQLLLQLIVQAKRQGDSWHSNGSLWLNRAVSVYGNQACQRECYRHPTHQQADVHRSPLEQRLLLEVLQLALRHIGKHQVLLYSNPAGFVLTVPAGQKSWHGGKHCACRNMLGLPYTGGASKSDSGKCQSHLQRGMQG